MNLGRQIHTLLKRQSSVYVNRLGTFKRVHTPATFDAKRRVFLPPITFIEFDSAATSGYDFVTYVQQANQLERAEAELLVEESVSSILDKLNQLGQVSLDNLGQLISYGNSYVFKPLDLSGFNYTAVEDHFPVDNVIVKEDTDIVVEEPIVTVPDAEEVPLPIIPEVKVQEEEIVAPVEVATDEPQPMDVTAATTVVDLDPVLPVERKSTSAYVYAIVAVIAVALLGGLYYYSTYMQATPVLVPEKQEIVPLDTIPADTLVAALPVDSALLTQDSTSLSPEADVEEKKAKEIMPTPVNHRYTIVIGTHRTLAQAYEEADAFNKDGHKSVRVITPNLAKNLKRVVWDTYASKEERDSALRYVKKHIKTDAWPDVIR